MQDFFIFFNESIMAFFEASTTKTAAVYLFVPVFVHLETPLAGVEF